MSYSCKPTILCYLSLSTSTAMRNSFMLSLLTLAIPLSVKFLFLFTLFKQLAIDFVNWDNLPNCNAKHEPNCKEKQNHVQLWTHFFGSEECWQRNLKGFETLHAIWVTEFDPIIKFFFDCQSFVGLNEIQVPFFCFFFWDFRQVNLVRVVLLCKSVVSFSYTSSAEATIIINVQKFVGVEVNHITLF